MNVIRCIIHNYQELGFGGDQQLSIRKRINKYTFQWNRLSNKKEQTADKQSPTCISKSLCQMKGSKESSRKGKTAGTESRLVDALV